MRASLKTKAASPTNVLQKVVQGFGKFQNDLVEEVRYNKLTLSQYRDRISWNFNNIFEKFSTNQWKTTASARDDIQSYAAKFNQIYNDAIENLERQKNVINAMNAKVYVRPKQFDESLEQFKKFYNESTVIEDTVKYFKEQSTKLSVKATETAVKAAVELGSRGARQREREFRRASNRLAEIIKQEQRKEKRTRIVKRKSSGGTASQLDLSGFPVQLELLNKRLKLQWAQATRVSSDSIYSSEYIRTVLNDLHKLQEDLLVKAQRLTASSQQAILESKDKYLVRRQKDELRDQLLKLENEIFVWVGDKRSQLDVALKLLQERVAGN